MDTLKKQVIRTLALATNSDALKTNSVILTTAAGIISGTLANRNDDDIKTKFYSQILNEVVESYGPEKIIGNDGCLHLTAATIITGSNNRVNVGDILVFYDQIIGVSIGTLD